MSNSIELELQKFPKTAVLKDGRKATLRPLQKTDKKEFTNCSSASPNQSGCSSSIA